MQRKMASTLVLVAAAAVAGGCGEQQQSPPTAPEYHVIAGTMSGCDSTHLKQLVNTYFTTPRQQTVRTLLSSMFAQPAFSSGAKTFGFQVLANVDTVVSAGTAGDSTVGSNLVNHLILCMYDPKADSASYPKTFPEDFTIALSPSSAVHGQFHVKPSSAPDALPVLSRDTLHPFSGIGLSSGTWSTTLSGNTPAGVLIYGRPGPISTIYDWRTLPRNATFNPEIIVGVCVTSATALLNDDGALLSFADASFLDPATCAQTALRSPNGPSLFAQRLIRLGAGVLGPHALWAAALSPGGTGGLTGHAGSEFGASDVSRVAFQFVQQPTSTSVNTAIAPPVTILATAVLTAGGSKPIPNVSITVNAVNNNGTPATLNGTTTQITNGNGIATYSDLSETKTGGYALTVTAAQVLERSAIPVGLGATSKKFNISPK